MTARKEKYFHLIVGGGQAFDGPKYDEIYKYEDGEWSPAGRMKKKRFYHAVSAVSKQDILQNCLRT